MRGQEILLENGFAISIVRQVLEYKLIIITPGGDETEVIISEDEIEDVKDMIKEVTHRGF